MARQDRDKIDRNGPRDMGLSTGNDQLSTKGREEPIMRKKITEVDLKTERAFLDTFLGRLEITWINRRTGWLGTENGRSWMFAANQTVEISKEIS